MMNSPVSQALQARVDLFQQKTRFNASSLIVSVFGDAILPRGGCVWMGSLIQLLAPLGLNERLVRTTVFRLVKDEWLQAQARGRRTDYSLTHSALRRFEEADRQIYAPTPPLWDRRWRLITVIKDIETAQRERLRRALYWQGFGELGGSCFVHPSADLALVFDALRADGMTDLLAHLMPLEATNLRLLHCANDAELIQSTWDLGSLAQGYTAFVQRYQPVLNALQHSPLEEPGEQLAFLVRTLLIHDYRRLLLRDPELPEVLLPTDWPGHAARIQTRELYRRLLASSERFLDKHLMLADGEIPLASGLIAERFRLGVSAEAVAPHTARFFDA